jgi:hypothetical protein
MKFYKGIALFAIAAALSVAMTACGGSDTPESADGDGAPGVEQLTDVSGAEVRLGEGVTEATVDVTLAEGEALVIMANFESNPGEVITTTSMNGEELGSDCFYDGYGYTEIGYDPGDYTVDISAPEATGTMWVLAYPANQVDVMTMDSQQIVETVLSDVK